MRIKTIKSGFFDRLKMAGAVLRGAMPWDAETLSRFFGGGSNGGGGPQRSYGQVAAVYACVRARAQAISGMPLHISTAGDEVLESGPLVELAEQPNPGMTGRVFWQTSSSILDLFGKVHWVLEHDTSRRVTALYPVAPPQMRAIRNERTGEVTSWRYRPAGRLGGQEETLSPEEVHTIVDPDFESPHDPLKGLSPRQAVSAAIQQYFLSDEANIASLANGVEPGGVFTMDGLPTEPQIRDTREQLADRHQGVRNRRRFLLLYGGLKFERMAAAFNEMEFTELKKMAREDICAAFGVPPAVLGWYSDSNYSHSQSASEIVWMQTHLPRAARFAEEWQAAALRGRDQDRALSLVNAQRRKLESRQRCCAGFRRARHTARRTSIRFYAWFDSSGVAAIQKATLERAEQATKWFAMGVPLNSIIRATDAPFEEVSWGQVGYLPIGLRPADEDVLDTFDDPDGSDPETGLLTGGRQRAGEGRSGGEQSMSEAAQALGQSADEAEPFNIDDPRVRELMRARDIRLSDVNRTLRRRLANKLGDAIEQGETVSRMRELIREEFNFAATRSATIARTEVGAAVEESRHEGRRQAGVPLKSWLSSRRETGRPAHMHTEIETMARPVSNEDPFTISGTGVECMHPRASGEPGEDINCSCTSISRYPDDSMRSVLDRYTQHGFLSYEQLATRDAAKLNSQHTRDGDNGKDGE